MRVFVSGKLLAAVCAIVVGCVAQLSLAANLLPGVTSAESWRVDQLNGARGSVSVQGNVVDITIDQTTAHPEHLQVFLGDLDLQEGLTYTVSGEIKATTSRVIVLNASIDEDDWHEIGLHEEIRLEPAFQQFEFTFRVSDAVRRKNRLGVIVGQSPGSIQIQNLQLIKK
ncbi:hypothetical protein SH668x_002397 [Planctomicrobium sp. SH668]|uniref:hypothetical protein n=1 Tax=Planctomicrobium sp. SH668 TaxID=3448126 RepID=UPI003F5AF7DC